MDLSIFYSLTLTSQLIIISIIASCMGSFASFISYRIAYGQSILAGRSQCVSCHKNLKWYNLIPLFSWLIQRGKCSLCHVKISLRYPLIEITFIIAFLIIFFAFGQKINQQTLLMAIIASLLIIISIIDLESYFIPDFLQYLLIICGVFLFINWSNPQEILSFFIPAFYFAAFPLAMLALFYGLTQKEAIGIDDVKFFFICGFFLGINKFLLFLMITGLVSVAHGLLHKKFKAENFFPFAPSICVALFCCLLIERKTDPLQIVSNFLTRVFF